MAEFDKRLDEVERALKIIATIDNNPELQNRAFDLLFGTEANPTAAKAGGERDEVVSASPGTTGPDGSGAGSGSGKAARAKTTAKRSTRTANVSPDKSVNLTPKDADGWTDFAAQKAPTNLNDKYTVAIYWLQEIAAETPITIAKVVYLFIAAQWNLPTQVKNKASIASGAGLIETSDFQNLSVTGLGTARVINGLPPK